MYKALHEGNHPDVARSLNNVGATYQDLGKPQEALQYLEQGLAMYKALHEGNHPDVARSLNNVGAAYQDLGKPQEALQYLEQAFLIMRKAYGAEHLSTQKVKDNMELLAGRLAKAGPFIQACVAGNKALAASMPIGSFEKDLHDAQGNPLVCWMAQHGMMAILEEVLKLGWNPNLPNKNQVYPLHYGAMQNLDLTRLLFQAGAHPFVQTGKGNTSAQVARNKGNIATLAVLLPSLEGISFRDKAAFEESYLAYKEHFATHHQAAGELLAAWELALQPGDADLVRAIQAKPASQDLLEQLIKRYPLAEDAIQARFESMVR